MVSSVREAPALDQNGLISENSDDDGSESKEEAEFNNERA